MSEWEDQINSILSDPEQMSRITELANSLLSGGGSAGAAAEADAAGSMPDLSRLAESFRGGGSADSALLGRLGRLLHSARADNGREQALLEAMKPYLSEKRRSKMDRAMRLAHMAKLAQLAMGELGGEQDV